MAFPHTFIGLDGTVVERPEPLVPRDFETAVIAFEIAVMHLVVERPQRQPIFVLHQLSLKTGMRGDGG